MDLEGAEPWLGLGRGGVGHGLGGHLRGGSLHSGVLPFRLLRAPALPVLAIAR